MTKEQTLTISGVAQSDPEIEVYPGSEGPAPEMSSQVRLLTETGEMYLACFEKEDLLNRSMETINNGSVISVTGYISSGLSFYPDDNGIDRSIPALIVASLNNVQN